MCVGASVQYPTNVAIAFPTKNLGEPHTCACINDFTHDQTDDSFGFISNAVYQAVQDCAIVPCIETIFPHPLERLFDHRFIM